MTEDRWDYFCRRGLNGISELYRTPSGLSTPTERFRTMERLRKGFFWLPLGGDTGLSSEWASGWFDFEDEALSTEEAAHIIQQWMDEDIWPGRP